MLFSCQKSPALRRPTWVGSGLHLPKVRHQATAPVPVTEFYGVAADAQLKAVVSCQYPVARSPAGQTLTRIRNLPLTAARQSSALNWLLGTDFWWS